jgi:tetratricopeptide (TPR) repeat protein
MKGRKIFGDLVPFGKVWRTGANQATTLTFGDAVTIGGTKIPAGKYGLLSIPGEGDWTLIITRQLDVTNPAAYKPDQDVVRWQTKPIPAPSTETFSILFNNVTSSTCDLQLVWEKTMVVLPISTDVDSKVMAQIDNVMGRDTHPYFAAALYYLDNGKDLNKALEWFDKAIAQDPSAGGSFFIVYQKARCLAKMGKKADAKSTAQKGIDLAKQANNADYVALNEKLIATL